MSLSASAIDETPILPRPHRVHGRGSVGFTGEGEVVVELDGHADATVRIAGDTAFSFESADGSGGDGGEPPRRMPRPGELMWVGAKGRLTVRGHRLDLRVVGRVTASAVGRFDLALDGDGEVESARGDVVGWGLRARTLRVDRTPSFTVPEWAEPYVRTHGKDGAAA